ncbi:MAG: urease subunit gamma [Acidobacteriota bacterium]|nr:urease subunit gamma [Acidobacteriota bacterium]
MHLTPREIDKLILHQAGFLAQRRLARGLRLNYVEAVALIGTQLLEFIRDGRSVADLMDLGRQLLGTRDVLDGIAGMVDEVQVEGTFPDGTKLVTVHHPIVTERGDYALALYGSFLTPPADEVSPGRAAAPLEGSPGAVEPEIGDVVLNEGREPIELAVTNTGDRPIQVGSHYHFLETNAALAFNRRTAYGRRLDIPAGTAVRFEPGETKTVTLVPIAGGRIVHGGNAWASGKVTEGRELGGWE